MKPLSTEWPLLLASASPRRREILTNLGLPFRVRAISADETTRRGEYASAYLERVVSAKLEAALSAVRDETESDTVGVVLVADTSVIVDGTILGKPISEEDAAAMIARLAGRTHEVSTRFALATGGGDLLHAETVTTRVTFRTLSADRVRAYVVTGEGADKAGAYAVQGRGAALVSRIDGSYTNVVGLPACEVVSALERLGLVP